MGAMLGERFAVEPLAEALEQDPLETHQQLRQLAEQTGLPFLGRLELRRDYRDTSRPTVLNSNAVLSEYRHIAEQAKLALEQVTAGVA